MLMNLGGVSMTVPVYSEDGTLLQDGELQTREDNEAEISRQIYSTICNDIADVNSICTSTLSVSETVEAYVDDSGDPYYCLEINGGDNGIGLYSTYFEILAELFKKLESDFSDVWAIRMTIDSMNDVFTLCIGVRI